MKPQERTLFDPPAQQHSATSRDASRRIRGGAQALRERVYDYIRAHGPVTDEEIAEALQMNPSTERPRRVELQSAQRIRPEGEKKTRSGRRAQAWRAA